ncbi:protein FAM160B1 [Salmo trutta]|nr:protein FAM160B1-like [Salmo trutta]
MLSKFTYILQHAVEALAPSLPLQEDFVYHWKAITHYYIETSDDKDPVTDTNIPSHLEQMLDILTQEESERESGETGPCMEYLLHHKILETLYTLGKADCPPGMKQQVLSFYTKLLGRIRQPLLPHINVHRPVLKLIRLCGEILAAPTENEEIQFLCIVCAKLKQDPYLVNFFLENKVKRPDPKSPSAKGVREDLASPDTGQPQAEGKAAEPPDEPKAAADQSNINNYNIVTSLLNLTKSPDGRIVVKACEGLMLLVSLPEPAAAKCLTENTELCELLTDRLSAFYKALPTSMDPLDIETVESVNWGLDVYNMKDDAAIFTGKRALISFLSWLDYCDQLIKEAQKTAAVVLAKTVRKMFFVTVMEPQLMQTSEVGILTSTALLNRIIRQVTSEALLQEMVYFLLGEEKGPETLATIAQNPLRHRLIELCDHLSDEFRDYCGICQRWDWRGTPKALDKCNLDSPFFEGHFLKVLFDRMGRILDQPYDVNLQVTSVLSKLSLLPHPHMHESLLDPYINLGPGCRSLFSVIVRVVGELMLRIQRIPDFTPKLLLVRKRLLGLEPEGLKT